MEQSPRACHAWACSFGGVLFLDLTTRSLPGNDSGAGGGVRS